MTGAKPGGNLARAHVRQRHALADVGEEPTMSNPSSQFAIVTLSTPEISVYALPTEANKAAYCRRHGYHFHAYRERMDTRPPAWSKIPALCRSIEICEAEWFFWLDADALIANPTISLESLVDREADLIVAKDCNGINMGCFLLRNNARTREFLHLVDGRNAFTHHPWWEQAAVNDVLSSGESSICVRYVAQRLINSAPSGSESAAYQPGDFVLHLAGVSTEGRADHINRMLLGLPFRSRNELPELVRKHFPDGANGAEIGVQHGEFSDFLLRSGAFRHLYSIDVWRQIPNRTDISNVADEEQENIYHAARERLRKHQKLSTVIRGLSTEAAAAIPDSSLDFVYLDADHSYQACSAELEAYYPKVRPGGILAGHDYLDGELPEGVFGVKRSVDEFIASKQVEPLYVTREPWATWLFFKPMEDNCQPRCEGRMERRFAPVSGSRRAMKAPWKPEDLALVFVTCPRQPAYFATTLASAMLGDPLVARLRDVAVAVDAPTLACVESLLHYDRVRWLPLNNEETVRASSLCLQRRSCQNYCRALGLAPSGTRALLICEDDILFRAGWLAALLDCLNEMQSDGLEDFILTAYSAREHEEPALRRGRTYSTYVAEEFYGAQAVFYPAAEARAMQTLVWAHGVEDFVEPYDLQIKRRAMSRHHLYTTRHSLVQHVGRRTSGLGGNFHSSPSFFRRWPERTECDQRTDRA